jgi:hypothetical protein
MDLPPVTPKTRSSTRRALQDSPDNPFLATPEKHVEDTEATTISQLNFSPDLNISKSPYN